MKRTLMVLVLMTAVSLCANAQYSRIADIVGTDHNLSSTGGNSGEHSATNQQICYFCHTPHQQLNSSDPAVTRDNAGTMPLWNHYLSTKTYGVYSSPSFDALQTDIADVGTATPEGTTAVVSNLCLSCHDGTVGLNTLYKGEWNPGGTARQSPDFGGGVNKAVFMMSDSQKGNSAAGLRNEHPINFTYDAALAAKSVSLIVPGSSTNGFGGVRSGLTSSGGKFLPLFASNGNNKLQCATCHDVHSNANGTPFLRASTNQSELCLTCHGK